MCVLGSGVGKGTGLHHMNSVNLEGGMDGTAKIQVAVSKAGRMSLGKTQGVMETSVVC